MADLTLTDDTFSIVGTDGNTYTMDDPLQFMIDLSSDNLIGKDGQASFGSSDSINKLRAKIMEATGIPALSAPQVLRVIVAMGRFCEELQKKIASPPNSSLPTEPSPANPPTA